MSLLRPPWQGRARVRAGARFRRPRHRSDVAAFGAVSRGRPPRGIRAAGTWPRPPAWRRLGCRSTARPPPRPHWPDPPPRRSGGNSWCWRQGRAQLGQRLFQRGAQRHLRALDLRLGRDHRDDPRHAVPHGRRPARPRSRNRPSQDSTSTSGWRPRTWQTVLQRGRLGAVARIGDDAHLAPSPASPPVAKGGIEGSRIGWSSSSSARSYGDPVHAGRGPHRRSRGAPRHGARRDRPRPGHCASRPETRCRRARSGAGGLVENRQCAAVSTRSAARSACRCRSRGAEFDPPDRLPAAGVVGGGQRAQGRFLPGHDGRHKADDKLPVSMRASPVPPVVPGGGPIAGFGQDYGRARPAPRPVTASAAKCARLRPAGRPVQQLDRMHHRHAGARADLHHAADVARRDHLAAPSPPASPPCARFSSAEISGCSRL